MNNINNPGFESPNQKEEFKTDFNNDNNNINKDNKDSQNKVQINQILIGPYRVLPGRLSVSRTIGDAEAKLLYQFLMYSFMIFRKKISIL